MTDALKSDAMHLRLDTLWRSLKRTDHTEAVVHIDRPTFDAICSSKIAFHDGSLFYNDCDPVWRGLRIVFHHGGAPIPIAGVYPEPMAIPYDEPFCMYIEVVKRNGRRVYIDDRQTDKQFL